MLRDTTGQFAARTIDDVLMEIVADRTDVSMKSDGDAAIKALADDVASLRPLVRAIRDEPCAYPVAAKVSWRELRNRPPTERTASSISWRTSGAARFRTSTR